MKVFQALGLRMTFAAESALLRIFSIGHNTEAWITGLNAP
jgi:hypothetical protein